MTVSQLDEHLSIDEWFEWQAYDEYCFENADGGGDPFSVID